MKCFQRLYDLKLTRFELFMIFGIHASCYVMRASSLVFPTFANITPEWKCGLSGEYSQNCSVLRECDQNVTYQSPFYSARQEFGLICDRAYIAAIISSLQFVGVLIGTNVLGQISDVYGRRRVMLVVLCGEIIFGFGSGFAWDYVSLAVLRFLAGFFSGGGLVVMSVYLFESIKPHQRIFMFTVVSWPISLAIITGIAYFANNWRWFLIFPSISGVLAPLLVLFICPESLKWAKDRGKDEIAKIIEARIDMINGKAAAKKQELEPMGKENDDVKAAIEIAPIKGKKYAIRDLVATRQMMTLTAIMCMLWLTVALTSYTIGFDSRNFEGDFYVNQLLLASFYLAENIILFTLDTYVPKFNRRILHQGPQLMVAILTGAIAILLTIGLEGKSRLAVTFLAITSAFFVSFSWDAVYLCTAELFPTEVRATAFGVCNFFARLAVILAPQAVLLRDTWEAGPYLIMSCSGFISFGISYKFLPDTKNRELPSSVSDVIDILG